MSKFANFRHKNVSNKQTRLLACVEITPPLRRRRSSTTPRTATNVPSIETLYHLVFDFRFADGIRYAVCRGASAKVKGHAPFRTSKSSQTTRNTPRNSAKRFVTLRKHDSASKRNDSSAFRRARRTLATRRLDFDRFAPLRTVERVLNYSRLTSFTLLTSLKLRICRFEPFSIHS